MDTSLCRPLIPFYNKFALRHKQIQSRIKTDLRLAQGAKDMKLTIKEIAEMAQVAKSTVSKAINGQKGVSDENRQRILSLVHQLNFQPNASARALAQNKTGAIGLVLPHNAGFTLSGTYWMEITTGIASTASLHDYNLMLITPGLDDDLTKPIESVIRRKNIDGLIIGAEQIDTKSLMSLMLDEIPFVFLGRNPILQHYSVDVRNVDGAKKVVSTLVDRGYKNIGCIAGPEDYLYIRERIEGFQDVLDRQGLCSNRIIYTAYAEENTRENTRILLEKYPEIDALFLAAGGDFVFNVMDVLRLQGILNKNFGIGAFDDYRSMDYIDYPIIAAKQPLLEMGDKTAEILFSLIERKPPAEMNHFFDVSIILR